MTDLNKLADDLATLAAAKTYTAREQLAVDVLANLPAILAALREREVMRGALEKIAAIKIDWSGDWEAIQIATTLARQALSGGGDA
jgi:hypothetical protein